MHKLDIKKEKRKKEPTNQIGYEKLLTRVRSAYETKDPETFILLASLASNMACQYSSSEEEEWHIYLT